MWIGQILFNKFNNFFQEGVLSGGHYRPPECQARHKVAIIIPYRNREWQLKIFIHYMHPLLRRQELDFAIYVVNQVDEYA